VRRSAVVFGAVAIIAGAVAPTPAPAVTLAGPPVITMAIAGPAPGVVRIGWAKARDGGSPITTYGFSVSVNGGTTWSAVHSFASKSLVQFTQLSPSLVCSNTTPGSQGCLFRIYAANVLGFGPPSTPVALWTAPSAPRALDATADPAFDTAALSWRAPAVTGGFLIAGYDVLGSMDGAAPLLLTTVPSSAATVPCTAKRTCTYSVRAFNSQGKSPPSATATVTPAPGPVQHVALQNPASDAATGRSMLQLGWTPPLTGLPADSYQIDLCGLVVGVPTSCDPTSMGWTEVSEVFPTTPADPLAASANCQAGFATCLMRVRAVNVRGGVGPWRAIDLEPWAPFGLTVQPGPARGSVTVHFRGPAESGRAGPGTKHYRVIVCDTTCSAATNWHTVSDAVAYPPAGAAPYLAGSFACRAVPPGSAPQARLCRVRMQFVDGLGNAGIVSGAAGGNEHP
jgi:hypothetical protein